MKAKTDHAKAQRRKEKPTKTTPTTALAVSSTAGQAPIGWRADPLLTSTYDVEEWLGGLNSITDDEHFKAACTERIRLLGRMTVFAWIAIGQTLIRMRDRLPGGFTEWLKDMDFSRSSAYVFMSFAKSREPILKSKPLQKLGFSHLAAVCALPADEVNEIVRDGKIGNLTLEEFGAIPPSEARKLTKKVEKLEAQVKAGNAQKERDDDQIAELRKQMARIESSADRKDDPETTDDAEFKSACDRRYDQVDATLQAFLRAPPATRRQAAELYGWCIRVSMIVETFIYNPTLLDRLQPDIRAALEQVRDSIGKVRDED